jgi:hypothetical protein
MTTDRIDFISAYCDRWCDRCAYTSRCSAFAVTAAVAMCGDAAEGLELAVGRPRDPDGDNALPAWISELENVEMTPAEEAEYDRLEAEREARVDATDVHQIAHGVSLLTHEWLPERYEALAARADSVLREALAVAIHDAFLISIKLDRALDGRDRHRRGEADADDHPVQNDWNGSAKVALISIERSVGAWQVIAQATGHDTPAEIARALQDLGAQVEREFPDAWSFVRPGFDEPGR